jgi:hypothetical protein
VIGYARRFVADAPHPVVRAAIVHCSLIRDRLYPAGAMTVFHDPFALSAIEGRASFRVSTAFGTNGSMSPDLTQRDPAFCRL